LCSLVKPLRPRNQIRSLLIPGNNREAALRRGFALFGETRAAKSAWE
jgi:hypothetical protein